MTELSVQFAKEQPEWEKWVVEQVPLRRAAQMSEIAKAALFLLSDDASYVTGAVLDANGGWVSP
jgi:3-oxoacyl-[acyl-carrier protein] reductase